ncbi:MAG: archease [Candidatus Heimdallarchaeaceae archaeon]
MGEFKLLEEETTGDFAFEAYASTLEELFESVGLATMTAMVDLNSIDGKDDYEFEISATNLEMLLYEFLSEIIFVKDVERVFFKEFEVKITEGEDYKLSCKARISPIDWEKQIHFTDVKAATMHKMVIEQRNDGWFCRAILDL